MPKETETKIPEMKKKSNPVEEKEIPTFDSKEPIISNIKDGVSIHTGKDPITFPTGALPDRKETSDGEDTASKAAKRQKEEQEIIMIHAWRLQECFQAAKQIMASELKPDAADLNFDGGPDSDFTKAIAGHPNTVLLAQKLYEGVTKEIHLPFESDNDENDFEEEE